MIKIIEAVRFEYGCVMAIIEESFSKKILSINKHLIPDNILYHEKGEVYGREIEPHVTIKFGLTKDYSKEDMEKVVSYIHPFKVNLLKIDIFSNEKFDVVKINVESEELNKLNKLFSKLPNEDEYSIYHPHITLAYVKKGKGELFKKSIKPMEVTINSIKYSTPTKKYFFNLV